MSNKECLGNQVMRYHQAKFKKVHKKIMKPVTWNGYEFESVRACAKFFGYQNSGVIGNAIRNKKEIKGFIPEFKKK